MYLCIFEHALVLLFFFFNHTATTEIYTLSLHDALPSCAPACARAFAAAEPVSRTSARTVLPASSSARAVAPPCCPVAPTTENTPPGVLPEPFSNWVMT